MSEKETTVAKNLTSPAHEVPGNGSAPISSGNGTKPTSSDVQHKPIPARDSESVIKAKDILRGREDDPRELLKIAKALKNEMRFGYARRLLARASTHKTLASDHELREVIFQQFALCTYKDQDLPADKRLDRALEILRTIADFSTTKTSETLGLIAAIYKRKWEIDNQRRNLELSLSYYRRGYEEGVDKDQGYTGINAAFVLDRLANIEELEAAEAGRTSDVAREHREEARQIRATIVKELVKLVEKEEHKWLEREWFYYATLAEAAFGLQDYKKAVEWIQEGQEKAKPVNEWELETCARQLASLARLQPTKDLSEPWQALKDGFGDDAVSRNAFVGKIGLALSGGGFRASLYHLGVLARLAELDVLRNVEVLSCVSGGAIVGAYYYLKVRHLLHNKTNSEITREDYINVVRDMIDEFTAGVQKNIRTRVAVNPLKNFRMFWSADYSRTARAAELYERHLYSQVKDGEESGDRWLNDLTIAPLIIRSGKRERDYSFVPKYHNWRRDAKVPILVLNAATLNTGHTWQFTASWMGEAPGGIDTEIDGNERLRRMYYPDAPGKHKRVRLGHAVGASAAVPGVFEPLTMDLLYKDHIVRLADGGVCDNQGLATLFEQDCKVILVSDASGQMESQPASSRGIFGVLLRTNDIFQARIREAQYTHLKGQYRSSLLRGFMFVHLKGDLDVDPVDWLGCLDPYDASDDARPSSRRGLDTKYGIAKDIQRHLSALRTDLDSFSEAEAYALMTSGYCMTAHQLKMERPLEGFVEPSKDEDWKFLEIKEYMTGAGRNGYEYLKQLLSAGSSLAFKAWQIDPILKWFARASFFLIIAGIIAAIYFWWNSPLPESVVQRGTGFLDTLAISLNTLTPQKVVTWLFWLIGASVVLYLLARLLTVLFGMFIAENVMLLVRWKDTLRRIALACFISTFGCAAAFIHLYIFDKRFLNLSTLEKIKQKNG